MRAGCERVPMRYARGDSNTACTTRLPGPSSLAGASSVKLPSGPVSVLRAWIRRQTGLSITDLRPEWLKRVCGPRPHALPLQCSSR